MKLVTKIFGAVIVGAIVLGTAYAQFSKPDQAIRYRKSIMFLISQHVGRMGAVIKGKAPYEKAEFARNAEAVKAITSLDWGAFQMPGSDKGDTKLKNAVFKQQSKFNANVKALQNDAAKLADTAMGGNFGAIKSQFGELTKNCKNCHQTFRK